MAESVCQCGARVSEGAAFCSACGQSVAHGGAAKSWRAWMIAAVAVIVLFGLGIIISAEIEQSNDRRIAETGRDADRAEQELRAFREAGRQSGEGSAPTFASRDGEVILSEYNLLRSGISYEEAARIIGFPGTEMSSSDLAGIRTIMFAWSNPDGSNMNAMFQNGRLIQKAQFGLR